MTAEWNFFATSHSKSPCHGIAGTTKQLVARASLQHPLEKQILTPKDLYDICNENINGIKFAFVSKEQIEQEEWFQHGHTLAETRENHHFVPICETIRVSSVSNDGTSFLAKIIGGDITGVLEADLQPGQYVTCI
ncbi:hypothetical protein PR048_013478 [Dryococelus australis]|uniref:Uncharacterized protein n=1 Tax=Dryococelus australis TaxID=614101 RepID=A0ABQ9HSA2_9NEOP|nr:hypothetical protein PR048_013478 [Dryococelus australis]